jgi:predicted dehydrogenase
MGDNILIYGFGRMGLTHYGILNQLKENASFIFIDPDKKVNFFGKKNLNAKILTSDRDLPGHFNYALICTPPMFHIPILENCINNNVSNIFVEKPFGGVKDDFSAAIKADKNIKIGYVLRFNPIIQWVKQHIDITKILKVEGYYFSNTLEKKPKGWRNGTYSGVTNEIGSHIIDLAVYLFGLSNPLLINKQIVSKISNVDDILIADLVENDVQFHFHFDWVNKEYRKPVFKFVILMNDGTVMKFDQQKSEIFKDDNLIRRITSVDIPISIPFYLRGVDFTCQMQDFVGAQTTMATVCDALVTRELISKLIL